MRTLITTISLLAACSIGQAHAIKKYHGTIEFTQNEKQRHLRKIDRFTEIGRNCLLSYRQEHINYYRQNCIYSRKTGEPVCLSKFYGDRRYSKFENDYRTDGVALKWLKEALEEHGWPANKMQELKNISCIGMAVNCLEEAFVRTRQQSAWNKIRQYVIVQNDTRGNVLLHALSLLGWQTMYWNPLDHSEIPTEGALWDDEELTWQSKGDHVWRYRNVMSSRGPGGKGFYWGNVIDDRDSLVGFGQQPPSLLYQTPFWVGLAHTGYHVFPGTFQEVVEAHSTREITSANNLEFSEFNPMTPGGGPRWTRTEKYRSGLIAIPPKKSHSTGLIWF